MDQVLLHKKNLLFLTMVRMQEVKSRGIYTDLLRKFRDEGYDVYIVAPLERRLGLPTGIKVQDGAHILGVRTLNLQKTSIIEKGVGQILVERQYKRAINKYLKHLHLDLIVYSTPPVTFSRVIGYLKRKSPTARTYLLLKDIFPQNAVDLGLIKKTGVKGVLYQYFRGKEKNLYKVSDYIGCMSPANVRYVLEHNPFISNQQVEVAPNSVALENTLPVDRRMVRERYGLPERQTIFIYGGNLGKPQGVDFLIQCLDANAHCLHAHFVVIGSGTELPRLKRWSAKRVPSSVTVIDGVPKEEYDQLVQACDVGLIFLDHRFTIPNYPSRLLSYLENRMPVLCATDPNTDIGKIAEENGYGYWCESNSVEAFNATVNKLLSSDIRSMGEKGYEFFTKNYLVENTFNAIARHV